MNFVTNSYIGAMCHEYRRLKLKGVTQGDVARETGVSRELVSKFERGQSGHAALFLWYIKKGIFDWIPLEKWNGWGMGLDGDI